MKKKEDFNGEKMDDPTEEVKGQPSEEKEKPQLTAEEIERKQGKLQCDNQIYVYSRAALTEGDQLMSSPPV